MSDEQSITSPTTSSYVSGFASGSRRYFDFLDSSHSVFSRASYYSDKSSIHPWLRRPCSRNSGIPYSALYGRPCTPRTEELAKPKIKRERHIRQEFFDNLTNYAYSGVKPVTLTRHCSERITQLARPKPTPTGYKYAYDLPRPVPGGALQAHISKRIEQLAKPKHNKDTYLKSLWNEK